MKQVSLRDFQHKASLYLEELPIVLTHYGEPKYIVSTFKKNVSTNRGNVLTDNGFIEDISRNVSTNTSDRENVSTQQRASLVEEGFISHKCSWDKGFHCPSPGVREWKGKHYCMPHYTKIMEAIKK